MEVELTSDMQATLDHLATATGRSRGDIVVDAMAGYFDELMHVRETLDSRYDDIKSGRVQLIDGEEAFSRLRAKSEALRNQRS